MVAHAAQIRVFAAMAELDERLGERLLCPTLWIGFGGIVEEAIVGGEDIGQELREFAFGCESSGFGDEKVVAVSENAAYVLNFILANCFAFAQGCGEELEFGKFRVEVMRGGGALRPLGSRWM